MSSPFGTAWVIGASSGIGRELARLLAEQGTLVTVSARRAGRLHQLEDQCPAGRIRVLPLDITDDDAVRSAVAQVSQNDGLPDVVVISSGAYGPAAADDLDRTLFADIAKVNYLGVVSVLSALLPPYLERGRGHVAVVASVAGYRGLPLASAYGPTKAALINLCESLWPELATRGVHLQLVNPGFVATPMTATNNFPMPFMMSPDEAAQRLYRGLKSRRFEITFPKRFTWALKLLRVLPYGLYFPLIGRFTGVRRRAAERRS